MDDSSSDDSDCDWILYKDRPEWNDIQPVAQDDGLYPIVAIAYSEKYRDVYDYFRGVVAKEEKSERVLRLCTDALKLNPANYTVWQYRRTVLKYLNNNLKEELKYIGNVIENHPKNYQVWNHRRVIVEWLNDGSKELEFTENILKLDSKNYHAWQHRQWALTKFKLFEGELLYVDKLLQEDIRNNSAWNHRYFINNIGMEEGFTLKIIDKEISYTISALQKVTKNESAWNYLRGILLHSEQGLNEPKVIDFCKELYDNARLSINLLAFLADSAVELVQNGSEDSHKHLEFALKLMSDLANEYDVIRSSYWNYLQNELRIQYSNLIGEK